jgi:hypothetical protein
LLQYCKLAIEFGRGCFREREKIERMNEEREKTDE